MSVHAAHLARILGLLEDARAGKPGAMRRVNDHCQARVTDGGALPPELAAWYMEREAIYDVRDIARIIHVNVRHWSNFGTPPELDLIQSISKLVVDLEGALSRVASASASYASKRDDRP